MAGRQHRCCRVCVCVFLSFAVSAFDFHGGGTAVAVCLYYICYIRGSGQGLILIQAPTRMLSMTSALRCSPCSQRLRGAMVARRTPVPKAACSSHVGVKAGFCFENKCLF
jgi:hypothetical protein